MGAYHGDMGSQSLLGRAIMAVALGSVCCVLHAVWLTNTAK